MAGRRIEKARELVLDRFADPRIALGFAFRDRLGHEDARDALAVGIHGRHLRHALVKVDRHRGVLQIAGHAAVGIAGEIEIEVDRRAPLQVADIDAGLAQPLHGGEADHHAGPWNAGRVAAGAAVAVAPAAGRQIDALLAPFARKRAYVLGRNAGFLLLPLGRLRNAVVVAEKIGLPLVEPTVVGRDVRSLS